jgi:hypothetical protein
MERCNLKILNDVEIKEQKQFNISNRFEDLEKFDKDNVESIGLGDLLQRGNSCSSPSIKVKHRT